MAIIKKSINFLLENSLFLISGTILALFFANLGAHTYHEIVHHEILYKLNFHFIVNDVLMCFFFALAAKEIWEALLPGGALSSIKKAATPLLATTGGILGPAGLYILGTILFKTPELARGWAVPCATDIAFSYMVARLVFGKEHPAIPFLLLLAIADDAAGLVILAVAYPTGAIHIPLFFVCVGGAVIFNAIVLRKFFKINSFWLYLLIAGPISWYGFFKGGIHPALALVPIIPTIPHKAFIKKSYFEGTQDRYPHDPLNTFEHWWKNPVELILMLFGFANAGVAFSAMGTGTWLVTIGLLIGKPIGIVLFTLFACSLLKLEMPKGMNYRDVVVLGCMAGIGFTVALFVASVTFPSGKNLDAAKMGALFSFLAAAIAIIAAKLLRVGIFSQKRL